MTQTWSVDIGALSVMRRANRAGTGSASFTVHGANMGLVTYTGRAREGHTGCETTEWESETSVRCLVGHGARGTRRVVMTVGEHGESVTQAWSVEIGALSVMRRENRAGAGSASVTVHGASMGLVAYTGRAREGHTGCEATEWVEVSCCARITWYSASGDDDGRSRRKRNAVMVGRSCRAQCYAATEPCWNGLNLGHYSRVQHGACHIHWAGPRGTHRV